MNGLLAKALPKSPAPPKDGQRAYQKLVLMALQFLLHKEVFTAIVEQAKSGDVAQAIGGAVVRALLEQKQAAQSAGVTMDMPTLSAASVEVAERVTEAMALFGLVDDVPGTVKAAIDYGKTLTKGAA